MQGDKRRFPASITTPFPQEKFAGYLGLLGTTDVSTLTVSQVERVFVLIVHDFLSGSVSLDELSVMSGRLWTHATRHPEQFAQDLLDVLLGADELTFYVRRVDSQQSGERLLYFLRLVLRFYQQKHQNHSR